MKKLWLKMLHIVTMFTLILTLFFVQVAAASFPDIEGPAWDWALETIERLVDEGIIRGYEDNTFRPSRAVTNEEALTLFARSIGVNNEKNSEMVEIAQNKFEPVTSGFETFATKEAAWVLYRNILTKEELGGYLSEENKKNPMKRYEAAILITKIMGGEEEVKEKYMFVLDYADTEDIPAFAKGYVEYVRDRGIMQGMDNNMFSPLTEVTRAQICVMISKVMDSMDLKLKSCSIETVTKDSINVTLDGDFNDTYTIDNNTVARVVGEQVDISELKPGMQGYITTAYDDQLLWAIDIPKNIQTNEVKGIYEGSVTDSKGTYIKVKDLGDSSSVSEYYISGNTKFTYNGQTSPIGSFKVGDMVTAEVTGDKVITLKGEPKVKTITGATIKKINIYPDLSIEISHDDREYDDKEFFINEDAKVEKNNRNASLQDLLIGDSVELMLEYNIVAGVKATSTKQNQVGTIEKIVISNTPSIVLNTSLGSKEFAISRNADIYIDGKESSIYDLRLGFNVTLNIEGATATSIDVTSVTPAQQMTGTVKVVNTTFGFISIDIVDTATGVVRTENIFVNDDAAIIDSANPTKRMDLSDIKIDDTVTVTGSIKLGAFEATTVIVIATN